MIEACVMFFLATSILFFFVLIRGIILEWDYFKPVLIGILKWIGFGILYIMLIIGAVNSPDYVPKYYEYVNSLF